MADRRNHEKNGHVEAEEAADVEGFRQVGESEEEYDIHLRGDDMSPTCNKCKTELFMRNGIDMAKYQYSCECGETKLPRILGYQIFGMKNRRDNHGGNT